MTTTVQVKALDRQYFDDARSNEPVYGKMSKYVDRKWKTFYIYAVLGSQVPCKSTRDNCKTFVNCTVEVYTDLDSLDNGLLPKAVDSGVTVVFYY
jgi:hypothetical protein